MVATKQAAQEEHERTCITCNRDRGLPILLTRYALASKDLTKSSWYADCQKNTSKTNKKRLEAISDTYAPALSGNFRCDTVALLDDTAYYTQRRLRGGYLYVYNEALGENKWHAYIIHAEGYLTPFEIHAAPETPQLDASKPCKPFSNGVIASCITIPLPDRAGDIWIAYSEIKWTDAVLERVEKEGDAERSKHMRKFNVKAWLGESPQHEHAAPLTEIKKHVAEYNDNTIFAFSAVPLLHEGPLYGLDTGSEIIPLRKDAPHLNGPGKKVEIPSLANSSLLIQAAERNREKGAKYLPLILAIDDPVGIVTDLVGLMNVREEYFENQERYALPRQAAKNIGSLKDAIIKTGIKKYENDLRARHAKQAKVDGDVTTAGKELTLEAEQAEDEAMRRGWNRSDWEDEYYYRRFISTEHTKALEGYRAWRMYLFDHPKTLEKNWPPVVSERVASGNGAISIRRKWYSVDELIASDAEQGFKPLYDETKIKTEQDKYTEDLNGFGAAHLDNLAHTYVKAFQSDHLVAYYKSNFDENDLENGAVYAKSVSNCLADAGKREICSAFFQTQIVGGVTDKKNIIMRALALNNEILAQLIVTGTKDSQADADLAASFDESTKWETIRNFAFNVVSKLADTSSGYLGGVLKGFGHKLAEVHEATEIQKGLKKAAEDLKTAANNAKGVQEKNLREMDNLITQERAKLRKLDDAVARMQGVLDEHHYEFKTAQANETQLNKSLAEDAKKLLAVEEAAGEVAQYIKKAEGLVNKTAIAVLQAQLGTPATANLLNMKRGLLINEFMAILTATKGCVLTKVDWHLDLRQAAMGLANATVPQDNKKSGNWRESAAKRYEKIAEAMNYSPKDLARMAKTKGIHASTYSMFDSSDLRPLLGLARSGNNPKHFIEYMAGKTTINIPDNAAGIRAMDAKEVFAFWNPAPSATTTIFNQLKADYAAKKLKLAMLQGRQRAISEEQLRLSSSIDEAQRAVRGTEQELEALKRQGGHLNKIVGAHNNRVAETSQSIAENERQLASISREIKTLQSEIATQDAFIAKAERIIQANEAKGEFIVTEEGRITIFKGVASSVTVFCAALGTVSLMGATLKEMKNQYSDNGKLVEHTTKMIGAALGFINGAADCLNDLVVPAAKHIAKDAAEGTRTFRYARELERFSTAFGNKILQRGFAIGSAIFAIWDLKYAYDAFMSERRKVGIGYLVSTGLGVWATVYFLSFNNAKRSLVTGVGWPAVTVFTSAAVLSHVLSKFELNECQQYLTKCYFGKGDAKWSLYEDDKHFKRLFSNSTSENS
jgi:ABC-type transporter Mla subunit MlaD